MATKGKAFGPDPRFAYTYRELPIGATAVGLSDDLLKTGTWRTAIRPDFRAKTPLAARGARQAWTCEVSSPCSRRPFAERLKPLFGRTPFSCHMRPGLFSSLRSILQPEGI